MRISVRTAANVVIEYETAGIGERMIAFLIDSTVIFFYLMIIFSVLAGTGETQNYPVAVICILPWFFYDLISEIIGGGQSIGKKAMNIKVIRLDGRPPGLGDYLMRWFIGFFESRFYITFIGTAAIIGNNKGQRFGDMAAGTCIIKISRPIRAAMPTFAEEAEDFEVVYPEVGRLNDQDIRTVRQTLRTYKIKRDRIPVVTLSSRLKEVLKIESEKPDLVFLDTIIKDYDHLTAH